MDEAEIGFRCLVPTLRKEPPPPPVPEEEEGDLIEAFNSMANDDWRAAFTAEAETAAAAAAAAAAGWSDWKISGFGLGLGAIGDWTTTTTGGLCITGSRTCAVGGCCCCCSSGDGRTLGVVATTT